MVRTDLDRSRILFSWLIILWLVMPMSYAGAAPSVYPTGVTIYNRDKAYGAYTLFRMGASNKVVLIDMEGNVVNSWKSPTWSTFRNIGHAKPLPNKLLLVQLYDQLENKKLVEMDWSGHIVWKYYSSSFPFLHHDFQRLDSGNTLIVGSEYPFKVYANVAKRKIRNDVIKEIDRTGAVVWQWSTAAHYGQLPLTDGERNVIYSGNNPDIFHTNSIQEIPDNRYAVSNPAFRKGNLLVSQRNTSTVFIIDKATGDIVWSTRGQTLGEHDVKMIPGWLPGAGNILFFDNGWGGGVVKQYRNYSRVIEMNPVDQTLAWTYDAHLSQKSLLSFFSPYRSGEQRLPNGNTLICESAWGRIFEVAPDGEIVWEYINPEVVKNPQRDYANWLYRAYRVDYSWVGGGQPDPAGPFIW